MFYTPEVVGQTVDTVRVMNYDMYYGGGLEKILPVTAKMRPDIYGEKETDHERFITSSSSYLCVFVAHRCFFLLEHSRVWLTLVRCKRHRTHVHAAMGTGGHVLLEEIRAGRETRDGSAGVCLRLLRRAGHGE